MVVLNAVVVMDWRKVVVEFVSFHDNFKEKPASFSSDDNDDDSDL